MTDPAVFLAACKARADAAFTPCGEPGHTGHGLECRIEKGWPYDTRPVREAIALAADVPRLVAFAEAVLAACDEWRDENTIYAENLAYEIRAVAAEHLGEGA